jgi:hypothetical protein
MPVNRLYLRYPEWPEGDRILWDTAFKAGTDLFDDHGAAAHLAERTKQQLAYAYGEFLAFLSMRRRNLLARAPAQRINRKIIKAYVKSQPPSCGGVTMGIYLYHLWLVLRYICPRDGWSWLLSISKRPQLRPNASRSSIIWSPARRCMRWGSTSWTTP